MLFFDLETLPSDNPEVIKRIAATIKPPGNIKKPESIAQWMEENKEAEIKKQVAKTALDGAYGRIACIGFYNVDIGYGNTEANMTEREVIKFFYEELSILNPSTFCGHNIVNFDLPFLMHRSIVLGIKPPSSLLNAMRAKPWDDCIADTMILWGKDRHKYIGLDTLCWILGVKHDHADFDGSVVADTWETNPQKVIDYCAADVKATIEVYNKLTFGNSVF